MAQIRQSNLTRAEVDTIDEVQKTFNDVYRILREQQNEIGDLTPKKPGPDQKKPEPEVKRPPNAASRNTATPKKESDK